MRVEHAGLVALAAVVLLALPSSVAGGLRSDTSPGNPPNAYMAPRSSPDGLPAVVGTIPLTGLPDAPAYDPSNGNIYLPHSDPSGSGTWNGEVTVVSGESDGVVQEVQVGSNPWQPAYDPDGSSIYVPTFYGQSVSVISGVTNTVVATLPLTGGARTPTYDRLNHDIYVSAFQGLAVNVFNGSTNKLVASLPAPAFATAPVLDPQNGNLYFAGPGYGEPSNLSVISGTTNTLIANITLSTKIGGFGWGQGNGTPTFDPVNGDIYLSNAENDTIIVVSPGLGRVIATVGVGHQPDNPTCDPATGDIYVPNFRSNNMSVISGATNRVIANIPSLFAPGPAFWNPGDGYLFVPSQNYSAPWTGSNETVISPTTNSVIGVLRVGKDPLATVYDPVNGRMYLPNYFSENVTIIQATPAPPPARGPFSIFGLPTWESYALMVGMGAAPSLLLAALLIRRKRRSKRVREHGVPGGTKLAHPAGPPGRPAVGEDALPRV